MGGFIKELERRILETFLDREPDVAMVLQRIRMGQMSELLAKAILIAWKDRFETARLNPNYLVAPPTQEQLYAEGPPDIELGTLENGLRFGIRLLDRPRHTLILGNTGSGKSNCLRLIVMAIERLNNAQTDLSTGV